MVFSGKASISLVAEIMALLLFLLIPVQNSSGQCSMCRSTVEGSEAASAAGASLNLGILILLIPPVVIFATVFFKVFREASEGESLRKDEYGSGEASDT